MADQKMKQAQPAKSLFRRVGLWLALVVAVLALLVVVAGLFAEKFLNNPEIKRKIQQQAAAIGGISLDYEQIGIGYYPLPEIELAGFTFTLAEKVHGTVGSVRILPEFAGLLTGGMPTGRIELVRPALSITLEGQQTADNATNTGKQEKDGPTPMAGLSLGSSELVIRDGRIVVQSGKKKLAAEGVAMTLQLSLAGPDQITVDLTTTLARLALDSGSGHQVFDTLALSGSGAVSNDRMAIRLDELTLAQPALGLSGSLNRTAQGVQLNLAGKGIDVEATRAAALAIAGTITPIPEIFSYLTGGMVPEIHFVAEGASFADLGDYANFHLDGQLREGKVAVPEIGLDLTGVDGEVHLVDGVLRGDKVSARLGKSVGNSGTLALGLAEDSDLFQLELLVKADLAEAKDLLKDLVADLRFTDELDRITQLEGSGSGKLILGDSFSQLGVKLESLALQLTLAHVALPYPVRIDGGRLDFVGDGVTLQELSTTFGNATFSGIAGKLDWQQGLQLDVAIKESQLQLDELFFWLKQMEGLKPRLAEVTSVTGKVRLSEAHFKGAIDQPASWRYGAVGEMADVLVAAPAFPGKTGIAQSTFSLDERSLNLQKTNVTALDGDLQLQGTIGDWSSVDLRVDGTLGPESVAWLEKVLTVSKAYGIRAPLSFADARLIRKKNGESGFSGNVTFATGPVLTIAVKSGQKGLDVETLTVKGIGTDRAELKVSSSTSGTDVGFSGTLGHETLAALFVHPAAGKGLIQGDIGVKVPTAAKSLPTARGHLNGSELLLPLAGEETLRLGSIALQAKGATFRAEIGDLLWRTYLFNTVKGSVDVHHDTIRAAVDTVELCGIPATGKGSYGDGLVDIAVILNGKNLDVAKTYTCLTQGEVEMSGSMNVVGRISTTGRPEKLFASLEGPLEMHFANGVIKKGRTLPAILEVLNVTEVFKGRLPKLSSKGFHYLKLDIEGRFGGGKYTIDKILMDGETLDLVGNGYIDLDKGTLKVELLAAPFKTVDSVIKYIPGVNYLTGGSLVAIPLSVTGSLENPKVVVMSSSAVSKSLLNLGARTLNLPLKLLQSILPGNK